MKRTKLPWKIEDKRWISGDRKDIGMFFASDKGITTMPSVEEAEANAEYVLICCNNFHHMINSLESMMKVIDVLLVDSPFDAKMKKDIQEQSDKIKRSIANFDL